MVVGTLLSRELCLTLQLPLNVLTPFLKYCALWLSYMTGTRKVRGSNIQCHHVNLALGLLSDTLYPTLHQRDGSLLSKINFI